MNKCKRCQIEILDNRTVCPLCETVLTKTEVSEAESTYPDVRKKTQTLKRVMSIAEYILVVLGIFLAIINYYTVKQLNWSLVTGVCIVYVILTLHYSFNRRNGHIRKIFIQAFAAILLLAGIDAITGATGWSLRYGIPCAVILLDGILVICMLANFKDWQSYLLVQLFAVIVGLVILIMYFAGVVKNPVLPWCSFGVSALIFSFCFFLGNRKAKNELRRRFYI